MRALQYRTNGSKFERLAGNILRSKLELDVAGADSGEALSHDAHGKLRPVAFTTQVGQVKVLQASGHDLSRRVGGGFVGEMSVASQYALFQTP